MKTKPTNGKNPIKLAKESLPKKTARVVEMKERTQPKPTTPDPKYTQTLQQYQDGLRALQEHKFEKAKTALQKVVTSGFKELADRAQVHLNTCNQHLARTETAFKTSEEHYDYAVSLMNIGEYVEAREHLEAILKQNPRSDYTLYGMAVLNCLMNRGEEALQYLTQAIQVNPANRLQARNDTDFRNLADDPRFTELLYPETTDASGGRR